jgi:hypothetical protein
MYQTQNLPKTNFNAADADLFLRLGIVLALKKRAGWHLVRLAVEHGVVRLAGIVPTFYDRQLIAALASHVAGVRHVDDQLAVGDPSIRQQVTETERALGNAHSAADADAAPNQFVHLPILSESLEDILAGQRAAGATAN